MINKFSNNKYPFLIITLILTLFLLVLPTSTADAIVFDTFKAAMAGLATSFGPIKDYLITTLFIYVKSVAALLISVSILDRAIWLNLEMLTVHDGAGGIVTVGWGFISGLANMFLILIFIACAFAIILKIESFQAKKILPKLIIVALLMNFSLVFIGALIDISNIAYFTLLPQPGQGSLMGIVVEPFLNSALASIAIQTTSIAAMAAKLAVPFLAPFFQLAVITAIPVAIIPSIISSYLQIAIALVLSGTFFLYSFIFGARIFIIQLLAILSPLAFLCLILPQTQKYWDKWLRWLFEWLFVGVFLLFFLRLGFLLFGVLADQLQPPAIPTPWVPFIGGDIIAFFVFYFFVFIYLGILLYATKALMPEFVESGISAGKAIIMGGVIGAGATMGKGALVKAAQNVAATQGGKDSLVGHLGERLMTRGEESKIPVFSWAQKQLGAKMQTIPASLKTWGQDAQRDEIKKFEDGALKESKGIRAFVIGSSEETNMNKRIGYLMAAIKKGEAAELSEKIKPEKLAEVHQSLKEMGTGDEKVIARAFPQFHEEFGITKSNLLEGEIESFLEDTYEDLIKELRRLSEQDIQSLASNGTLINGRAFKSSAMGDLSKDDAKRLAPSTQEGGTKLTTSELRNLSWSHSEEELVKKRNQREKERLVKGIVASPESLSNMDLNALDDEELRPIFEEHLGARQVAALAGSDDEARQKIEKMFQNKIDRDGFEVFAKENPSAAAYFVSGAAQGAGVVVNTGKTQEEAQQIVRNVKKSAEQIAEELKVKREIERKKIEAEKEKIINKINESRAKLERYNALSIKEQESEAGLKIKLETKETIIKQEKKLREVESKLESILESNQ